MLSKKELDHESKEKLAARAKNRGITGYGNLSRQELISVLSNDAVDQPAEDTPDPRPLPKAEPDAFEENRAALDAIQAKTQAKAGAEKAKAKAETEQQQNSLPREDDRIWFKVAAGHTSLEKGPVFAALNGESILIKRNHWVKLKTDFLSVFRDAICTEVDIDEAGEAHVRHVPRFNIDTRSLAEGQPVEQTIPRGF